MNLSNALPIKAVIGNCEIRQVLGQGGGGISYLAFDLSLERPVVIKEHFPMGLCMRASNSAQVHPIEAELYAYALSVFCKEARILAGLNHPNIVKIYDIVEGAGTAYLIMEYIEGQKLQDFIPSPATDYETLNLTLCQLLQTFDYLHGNGVIHRDIKPANIIIRNDGSPVIIDFGSAHIGTANRTLTPVGSPGYAAPEQFSPHGRVGAWSDLYALAQCFLHHITTKLKKSCPTHFSKALQKAASAEITNRFQTAKEWLCTLQKRKNKMRLIIPAVLLIIIIMGVAHWKPTIIQKAEPPAPTTPTPRVEPPSPAEPGPQTTSARPQKSASPSIPPFATPLPPLIPKDSGMILTDEGRITTAPKKTQQ